MLESEHKNPVTTIILSFVTYADFFHSLRIGNDRERLQCDVHHRRRANSCASPHYHHREKLSPDQLIDSLGHEVPAKSFGRHPAQVVRLNF